MEFPEVTPVALYPPKALVIIRSDVTVRKDESELILNSFLANSLPGLRFDEAISQLFENMTSLQLSNSSETIV